MLKLYQLFEGAKGGGQGWVGQVAYMGEKSDSYGMLAGKPEDRRPL
jgi:hypothetical protein